MEMNKDHESLNIQEALQYAFWLFDQGKLDEANQAYERLWQQHAGMTEAQKRTLLMGTMYVQVALGRYDLAIADGKKLLGMSTGFGDRHTALHQLAMAYRAAGEYSQALRALEQERSLIQQQGGDDFRLAVNGYELSVVAIKQKRFDEAEHILMDSLRRAEIANDAMTLGCLYRAWGELGQATGRLAESKHHFGIAVDFFETAGDQIAAREAKALMDNLA